nr:myosin-binding protein 1 isoform X1 [Ipomoea batatas]
MFIAIMAMGLLKWKLRINLAQFLMEGCQEMLIEWNFCPPNGLVDHCRLFFRLLGMILDMLKLQDDQQCHPRIHDERNEMSEDSEKSAIKTSWKKRSRKRKLLVMRFASRLEKERRNAAATAADEAMAMISRLQDEKPFDRREKLNLDNNGAEWLVGRLKTAQDGGEKFAPTIRESREGKGAAEALGGI